MDIKEEDGMISITQKVMYEIVKKEDETLIKLLKDYARKNSVELRLLDEEKVKEIIKKGLMIYHAEEHKSYSHSYIHKSKIEDKINELSENGYWDFLESRDLELTIQILKELLEG